MEYLYSKQPLSMINTRLEFPFLLCYLTDKPLLWYVFMIDLAKAKYKRKKKTLSKKLFSLF